MTKTMVALYDDFAAAQRATRELLKNGLARHNISIVANDATGAYSQYVSHQATAASETVAAVGAGAVIGSLCGLLVTLGVLLVPDVGSIIAAGAIIIGLTAAGIGAAIGALAGLVRILADPGSLEEEANACAQGIHRGGALVTVNVADDSLDWAAEIMDRYQPIHIDRRADPWREREQAGFQPKTNLVEILR